ncbi:hypothetical protein K438DRAFT_1751279 [Mycena galopus ATCC 62051]|nr:hypothetical protein K438DRAFT_1751279 [Mycena galopus ATCC 62051]
MRCGLQKRGRNGFNALQTPGLEMKALGTQSRSSWWHSRSATLHRTPRTSSAAASPFARHLASQSESAPAPSRYLRLMGMALMQMVWATCFSHAGVSRACLSPVAAGLDVLLFSDGAPRNGSGGKGRAEAMRIPEKPLASAGGSAARSQEHPRLAFIVSGVKHSWSVNTRAPAMAVRGWKP